MTTDESLEMQRLRRQLRAVTAVNRQLHAQLEGRSVHIEGASGARVRDDLLADSSTWAGSGGRDALRKTARRARDLLAREGPTGAAARITRSAMRRLRRAARVMFE
jgi:hypothetical protein